MRFQEGVVVRLWLFCRPRRVCSESHGIGFVRRGW